MNEATLTLPRTKSLFLFLTFAAITLAPLTMVHSQWITGPLVNAMLILTCVLVGPMEAVILGLFPSVIALVSGLLPLPLAPMVPFIMIGNAVFVATFWYVSGLEFSSSERSASTALSTGSAERVEKLLDSSHLAAARRSSLEENAKLFRLIFGILAGALLKFLFLAATVRFLMVTILDAPIVQKLAIMMSWPQLATALIGGMIALLLLSLLPHRQN